MAWIPLLALLLLSAAPNGERHDPYQSTVSRAIAIAGTKEDFAREYFCWSPPALDAYSPRHDGLPDYSEPIPDLDFAAHNFGLGNRTIREEPQVPTSRSVIAEVIQFGAHPIDRIGSFGRELTTRLISSLDNTAQWLREIERQTRKRSRKSSQGHLGPAIAMTHAESDSSGPPSTAARLTDIRWAIRQTVSEAATHPDLEPLPVLLGRWEPSNEDFYCGYPAQLTFGFHTPKRIDAGLRWCFDCGAWQPCDCPSSTAIPELRSLIDGELRVNGFRDLQDELARIRAKLDALREARERTTYGVRANSPSATRDRIVSAFGILIPDSAGWPTVLRYFAKPLPGASLPKAAGDLSTVQTEFGSSP
ncbi:MAG: hypothetical protein AMXMBFR47_35470 [Planctomycetota bacterium]